MQQVTSSLLDAGDRRSDQSEVWSLIAEKSARLGATSDTAAMSAVFDKVGASLDELRGRVPAGRAPGGRRVPHQRPAGRPRAVRRGQHVAEAVAEAGEELRGGCAGPTRREASGPMASPDLPKQFAGAVASSPTAAFPAAGEGEDVRLTGSAIAGAALVARGRAVHVSAFPQRG